MNFPFLKRLPKNKRFYYEPRYYDPIKEEINIRTEKIKNELEGEKLSNYRSMISQGFARKQRQARSASSSQLVLIILLMSGFIGYLYYGNVAIYAFLGLFAFYIFIRTRKKFQ